MTWKEFFISSVGRKLVMSFSGIFLMLFLIVHATANGCIFKNDHGKTFNAVASFLSHNYIVRVLELGLFLGFILHIVQGFMLMRLNSQKRPVAYAVKPGNATSPWYSRSMGILGSLLLIFLVIHLSHFWIRTKYDLYISGDESNMFEQMKLTFHYAGGVVLYLVGVISLCWHLIHGFSSSMQTLGISSPKYNKMIRRAGIAYSLLICLAFALMPISIYFNWIE